MLAYSSISHGGYILVGVLATVVASSATTALAGVVLFYLVVYSVANLGRASPWRPGCSATRDGRDRGPSNGLGCRCIRS